MSLILENFAGNKSVSGIWKIEESEDDLHELCVLTDYDRKLLSDITSPLRRKEILATRVLINVLGLNIFIEYRDRKPLASNGNISITHSDSLVGIVWHETKKTTIDIEELSSRILRISKRAFSSDEFDFAGNDIKKLTLLWNCKESVYKLVGVSGLEFKTQIKVFPFNDMDKIECHFTKDGNIIKFTFEQNEILDHTYVWGFED